MRTHWTPDPGCFERLRKADTLAILAGRGRVDAGFPKLKRDAPAEAAANLLANSDWLPPTLRVDVS